MSKIKQSLYLKCLDFVNSRIRFANDGLQEAQDAANNETKSSAGDKYETARAMMHLEKEKLASQLSEALKMKKALDQIEPSKALSSVGLGALVETGMANYYISVSAGKLEVDGGVYFAISPLSPIGQELLGKSQGDQFQFAGKTQLIKSVI